MIELSQTEFICLQAVERRGAHCLSPADREAAMASMKAQGLVQDDLKTDAGFQIATITEAGRAALRSAIIRKP
jgi:hypothetical protein